MSWRIEFLAEARNDLKKLNHSKQSIVRNALSKVSQNPLPQNEGGYGKPLRNQNGSSLAGLCKIKLKADGLRIVYKLIRSETQMLIVVVGVRADEEVYSIADRRRKKYNL